MIINRLASRLEEDEQLPSSNISVLPVLQLVKMNSFFGQ